MVANLILSQVTSLRKQIDEFRELLDLPFENPSTVYIGDGYFVTMTQAEAKDFLIRKMRRAEHELKSLSRFGDLNDEGLPILDIVEELDEDGEIISSEVKPTGMGHFSMASINETKDTENSGNSIAEGASPRLSEVPTSENESDSSTQAEISATQATDEPAFVPDRDDEVEYIENVADTDSNAEDSSSGEFRDIDPLDILELELMGEDTEELDNEFDDVVDFDFDDVEEDDDDEEESSDSDEGENLYDWRGGSLFPQDEATRKIIQSHLAQTSNPITATNGSDTHSAKKLASKKNKNAHVHFANDVDVREFETSPAERKFMPIMTSPIRVSRFKASRQAVQEKSLSTSTAPSMSTQNRLPQQNRAASPQSVKAPSAAAAAAAAVVRKPPSSDIHRPAQHGPRPAYSGLPARSSPTLQQAKAARDVPTQSPTSNRSAPNKTASPNSSPASKFVASEKKASPSALPPSDKTEAETGSKAHPKSKITQDAERIFEGSFIPDDEFLKMHSVQQSPFTESSASSGADLKKESDQKDEPKGNDAPILSSVIERLSANESGEEPYDDDSDNTVNMTEIKQEYQRLRQKLIYESGGFKAKDAEKAVEPVEPDGSNKKVSRFKAARVA